jgi:hypothetical protein
MRKLIGASFVKYFAEYCFIPLRELIAIDYQLSDELKNF